MQELQQTFRDHQDQKAEQNDTKRQVGDRQGYNRLGETCRHVNRALPGPQSTSMAFLLPVSTAVPGALDCAARKKRGTGAKFTLK